MTRLLINLFLIVMLCFTLAVMPINTEIFHMFDLEEIFKSEKPIEEVTVPVDETFLPSFTINSSDFQEKRLYNPSNFSFTVHTNIPEMYEKNYTYDDLTVTFYKNDSVYQIFKNERITNGPDLNYVDGLLDITYNIILDGQTLQLKDDGFFDVKFDFTGQEKNDLIIPDLLLAYRPEIQYITNGDVQNNGNFIYKSFFLDEDESHLVPLYFSVKYPESITVEARNRLYKTPPIGSGLSQTAILPEKTSISKIGNEHYGIFMYSKYFPGVIDTPEKAELSISAISQSLLRLPHIKKLSFFVDDVQKEGSLYDVDLTHVYEEENTPYVYLTDTNSSNKRYLIPASVQDANIYDMVWQMFGILKSGVADEKQWTQIIPPEVMLNNFIIEGTTITLDLNSDFTEVYKDRPEYEILMMNSILYSLTSIENITKVSFTVDGTPLTAFAGYDLTEPLLAPPYINFIGEYNVNN